MTTDSITNPSLGALQTRTLKDLRVLYVKATDEKDLFAHGPARFPDLDLCLSANYSVFGGKVLPLDWFKKNALGERIFTLNLPSFDPYDLCTVLLVALSINAALINFELDSYAHTSRFAFA